MGFQPKSFTKVENNMICNTIPNLAAARGALTPTLGAVSVTAETHALCRSLLVSVCVSLRCEYT